MASTPRGLYACYTHNCKQYPASLVQICNHLHPHDEPTTPQGLRGRDIQRQIRSTNVNENINRDIKPSSHLFVLVQNNYGNTSTCLVIHEISRINVISPELAWNRFLQRASAFLEKIRATPAFQFPTESGAIKGQSNYLRV